MITVTPSRHIIAVALLTVALPVCWLLSAPASAMHFHGPAPASQNASVVLALRALLPM